MIEDWKFNYNKEDKRHFCGYKAWKEYELERNKFETAHSKHYFLLLPVIFIDDFLRDKSTKAMSTGVYLTFANFSNEVKNI